MILHFPSSESQAILYKRKINDALPGLVLRLLAGWSDLSEDAAYCGTDRVGLVVSSFSSSKCTFKLELLRLGEVTDPSEVRVFNTPRLGLKPTAA